MVRNQNSNSDFERYCVDESDVNNEPNFVESKYCNKLVTYFQVNESAKVLNTRMCVNHDSDEFRNILFCSSNWPNYCRSEATKLASDFNGNALVPDSLDPYKSQIPIPLIEFYEDDSYLVWIILAISILILIFSIAYIFIRLCKGFIYYSKLIILQYLTKPIFIYKAFPKKSVTIFISPFVDINHQESLAPIAKFLKCNMV